MINPIKLTEQVRETYLRYLVTAFEIADEGLRQAFREELTQGSGGGYTKGPYLEATPPFQRGRSLSQLVQARQLSSAWLDVPAVDLDRPLYWHQEQALTKVKQGRNVIVSTGTGSGKTEAFLYPIIDSLMYEHQQGGLTPGVRALLLYPMNALVNDQLKRLRELLCDIPYITFGRFTGETGETDAGALLEFRTDPPDNERISRKRMREDPPHLLVTNYAMLEYLLQRPADTPFFDGKFAEHWRYLVLDEVHTYSGASGAEVGMLIRRLKDRIGSRALQAIGTSATMGSGDRDYPQVAQFASQLFSETFEWVADDTTRQDVVGARRIRLNDLKKSWGRLPKEAYGALYTWAIANQIPTLAELSLLGLAGEQANLVRSQWLENVGQAIYGLLAGDGNIRDLSDALQESRPLEELIDQFRDRHEFEAFDFLAMVNVAAWAKPGPHDQSLIPARYHLFIRATEGVFVALYPERKIFLQRHESYTASGMSYPVFELGYCRRCGGAYLVGKFDGTEHLRPCAPFHWQDDVASQQSPDYFGLSQGDENIEDDTEELFATNFASFQLCQKCGWIADAKVLPPDTCDGGGAHQLLSLVKSPTSSQGYHRCVQCGAGSGRGPSRFITGQDAAAAVVATSVYSSLQPETLENLEAKDIGKLLIFSDSRQDAAFFAPYLENSYQRIVWRRLIWHALTTQKDNSLWVADVHQRLMALSVKYGMMALYPDLSPGQKEALVWEVILRELVSESDIGLERVGMVAIEPVIDPTWSPPSLPHWNDAESIWKVLTVLWNGFRARGALTLPAQVSPASILPYEPNRMPGFSRSTRAAGMMPWLPTKDGLRNGRLDYVAKLGMAQGWPEAQALGRARTLADEVFTYFTSPGQPWADANTHAARQGSLGIFFQAKHLRWTMRAVDTHEAFRCNTCGRVSVYSLGGICPAWKCAGHLEPLNVHRQRENHYYQLYSHIHPIPMVAREHTAQIHNRDAQKLQEDFSRGAVSVLSCSTTFELGVDAGELEAVFMRNVPPEPANYVQRAGRAGRRTSSAAIAITFAQRRSHDIAQFNHPERYVNGRVTAPRLVLSNEKIARRHLHAVVTSWYFRRHPEAFGEMKAFLNGNEPWDGHLRQLSAELHPVPTDLRASISAVIPAELHEQLELDDDQWVEKFIGPEGVLTESVTVLHETIDQIESLRQQRFKVGKPTDSFMRLIETLFKEHSLQFFPSHNVLPKYGFPVDLVQLRVMDSSPQAQRIDLTRDLSLAVLEYAPGNTVVAGGYLWKSHGLLRRPGLAWKTHDYAICGQCKYFAISQVGLPLSNGICPGCQHPLKRSSKMIVPQFGFTTSLADKPIKPGNQRPERVGVRQVFFSALGDDGPIPESFVLPNGNVVQWSYSKWGLFTVLNSGQYGRGYRICDTCGYAEPIRDMKTRWTSHNTSWGSSCPGKFTHDASLGHQFGTDVALLTLPNTQSVQNSFWISLLYAILEGSIEALSINRRDLGATLYWTGSKINPTLVLYDAVPGGAGHVRHVTDNWIPVLQEALKRVSGDCGCGPETSCYGCLRSYDNERFHENLKRGQVESFLVEVLTGSAD